jgi:tryptophanyl-tRNA synthetase
MSDHVKLAREIAARTKPRFIEIKPEPRTKLRRTNDWLFITIPRERGAG